MYKHSIIIFVFSFLNSVFCLSQNINAKNINRVKRAVVRIYVGNNSAGTGFLVLKDGWILSNRHVIETALVRNKDNDSILSIKPIYAKLYNEKVVELSINEAQLIGEENNLSVGMDFIFLKADYNSIKEFKMKPLKLGKWKHVNEGDYIYTAGYPLTVKELIISSGIISTKYETEKRLVSFVNRDTIIVKRNSAWCDITAHKGNSGGPVMKKRGLFKRDIVVGITSYGYNKYAERAKKRKMKYRENYIKTDKFVDAGKEETFNADMFYLHSSLLDQSEGITGIISIDYSRSKLALLNP